MKAVVFNIGCKVNQYECDVLTEKLAILGYEVSEDLEYADIYILNTCAVTQEAERKSRQAIARCLKYNPNAKVFVCGCASQKSGETFKKDGVIYITGVAGKQAILEHLQDSNQELNIVDLPKEYEDFSLTQPSRTRAFVKIQDGCNKFCTYCIIPFLRGRSRSRDLHEVVNEIKVLSQNTKEIVLTGIDVMSYGLDIGTNFTELIQSLKDIDVRIRLSSIYAESIDKPLLDALFNLRDFCPHFHLSMQSGDNQVLKKMNRHYTSEIYAEKIELIRQYDKLAGITTDIIVGFPTETDEAFNNTYMFLKEHEFSDVHIFPYSPRTGTVAAKMPILDKNIVVTRKNALNDLKTNLKANFIAKNIGSTNSVLIETKENGLNVGYTKNYIRVYTKKEGTIVNVQLDKPYLDGAIDKEI